jgi:hypothetical protein
VYIPLGPREGFDRDVELIKAFDAVIPENTLLINNKVKIKNNITVFKPLRL